MPYTLHFTHIYLHMHMCIPVCHRLLFRLSVSDGVPICYISISYIYLLSYVTIWINDDSEWKVEIERSTMQQHRLPSTQRPTQLRDSWKMCCIDSAVRNRFCTSSLITDPRCLSLITDAFRLLAFYIFNFHNYDIIFFLICMMMMWVIWRLICEHCQHHIWDMFAYALVYVFLYVMNCVFMCLLDVWS